MVYIKSLLLLLMIYQCAVMAADEPTFFNPKTVITPLKWQVSPDKVGNQIRVISKEEISALGAQSVQEALEVVSGLSVVNSGGQKSIFMGGLTSSSVKILINGFPLKDPIQTQGQAYFDGLNVASIDRIEIVDGAKSTLYGSEALAGVINIITTQAANSLVVESGVDYYAASHAYQTDLFGAIVGLNVNRVFDNRLSTRTNTTEKDAIQLDNIGFSVAYDLDKLDLDLRYSKQEGRFDLDAWSGKDDPNRHLNSFQSITGISASYPILNNLKSTFKFSRTFMARHDNDEADMVNPSAFPSVFNGVLDATDLSLLYIPNKDITSFIGFVSNTERASSTYFDEKNQAMTGVLGHVNWINDLLNMSIGVRRENYASQHVNTYSVSFFRNIPIINQTLKANINTGFREPSLYERYGSAGQTALTAETSHYQDLILEGTFLSDKVTLGGGIFDNQINNKIDYNNATNTYANTGTMTSRGYKAYLNVQAMGLLDFLRVDYTRTMSDMAGVRGNRIPDYKLTVISGAHWGPISGSMTAIRVGERRDGNTVLKPYHVLNSKISLRLSESYKIYGMAKNIFDHSYEEASGYTVLGRTLLAGVKYTF